MLGAVVLEGAAQVPHPGEQRQVAEEDHGPQRALDQPEQDRRAELVPDEVHQRDRHDEEQADREDEGDHQDRHPDAAGDLLGVLFAQLCARRDAERLETDRERLDQRDQAAQDRHAGERAQARTRCELELLDGDLTERALWGPSGAGLRTATAQCLTPRIITPSRTAWPPRGASVVAVRLGSLTALTHTICLSERSRRSSSGEPQRGPWRRDAGSARHGHRYRPASACRCRTGGIRRRSRRGSRGLVERVVKWFPHVQVTWDSM